MTLDDLPVQETSLLLSIALFLMASWVVILTRQASPLHLLAWMLWGLAALRLYSASSFVWGGPDAWFLPITRSVVVAVLTLELIGTIALVRYYLRRT